MRNTRHPLVTCRAAPRRWCGAFVLCITLLTWCVGCGGNRKPALTPEEIKRLTYAPEPQRPDELLVSGERITCDDIMNPLPQEGLTGPLLREELETLAKQATPEQFLTLARPRMQDRLNRSIAGVVLAKIAQRELGDNAAEALDKMAEKELRRYIMEEHGGNAAAAEEALQIRNMSRSSFKQWKKRQILAQYVLDSKYAKKPPITRRDLVAQYERTKDLDFRREGVVQFRLIEIWIAEVVPEDPNEDPTVAARQFAAELRRRIEAGEDFADLARQYSHDAYRGPQGGLWRPRDPNAWAPPYDAVARRAMTMAPGQVAGPIEAPGRFLIMRLEHKQVAGYQPLSEVQDELRRAIEYERNAQALLDLEEEIVRQFSLVDTSRFVDYCLERFYRLTSELAPGAEPAAETP